MVSTGTFLKISIKPVDTDTIPVIIGQDGSEYFVCLTDHLISFGFKSPEDIDEESFTGCMDGFSAQLVAAAVKQAVGLLAYCGGVIIG